MTRSIRNLLLVLAAVVVLIPGTVVEAAQPLDHDAWSEDILDNGTWAEVSAWLKETKDVIELGDASIIIEVNGTDGDAGFQVFLDGDGWENARVYDSNGIRILRVSATAGVRNIGGGTELFMESSEPEYEDLDGMQALIELLPEGEYFFLARTTDNNWATSTAELTHDIPAEPEIVTPAPPDNEDECSTGVFVDSAVIEWDPLETDIWGGSEIEIEGCQVIVEALAEDGPDRYFSVTVPADTTMVTVPEEVLAAGMEFKFEILAIEESGNQTITESCFETEEE
jgi:hypothetical protein